MFDWYKYLELADQTLQPIGEEEAYRSAISRAYYAAFHYSIHLCSIKGINYTANLNSMSKHKAIIRELQNHSDLEIREIGRKLNKLFNKRNKSDYEDQPNLDFVRETPLSIQRSEEIITKINELCSAP